MDQEWTFEGYFVHPFTTGHFLSNLKVGIFIKKPERTVYRARELAFDGENRTNLFI